MFSGLNLATIEAVVDVFGTLCPGLAKTNVGASLLTLTIGVHFVTSFFVSSYLQNPRCLCVAQSCTAIGIQVSFADGQMGFDALNIKGTAMLLA